MDWISSSSSLLRLKDEPKHSFNQVPIFVSHTLTSDNTRRVAEVARLMVDAGVTVLVALISPFEEDRHKARALFAQGQFVEVFVDAPLLVCMRRDVKGLYAKAQQGGVPAMTGMGSPYEPPTQPDLWLETGVDTLDNCVRQVMALVPI